MATTNEANRVASVILEQEISRINVAQGVPKFNIAPFSLSAKQINELMNMKLAKIPDKIYSIQIAGAEYVQAYQQGEFIIVKTKKLAPSTQQTVNSEAVGNLVQNYRAGEGNKQILTEGTILREIWEKLHALSKQAIFLIVTHKYKIVIAAGICIAAVLIMKGIGFGKKIVPALVAPTIIGPIAPILNDEEFWKELEDFARVIERMTQAKIESDTPKEKKQFISAFFATAQEVNDIAPVEDNKTILYYILRGDIVKVLELGNQVIDAILLIGSKLCKNEVLRQFLRTVSGQRWDLNADCTIYELLASKMRELLKKLSSIDFSLLTDKEKEQIIGKVASNILGPQWFTLEHTFHRFLCAYAETDQEFTKYLCLKYADILLPSKREKSLVKLTGFVYNLAKIAAEMTGISIFYYVFRVATLLPIQIVRQIRPIF